ncbi:sigma-70 family RNA polymerase sigma factor [Sorangium atrum]|uniref:Sigma-70 family RNA polymerase sigma factor n=1 Tax=Sorangium atrum TaxID=2995308 RepID=A0ABT5BZ91_9BACT|nr:sigma-70 family RNA polymerase sigma factor [Sorangium aterium]MDC0678276.1 sigma-70 family RNA polymerase sigma factor [Sorangium aterium]
MGHLSNEDERAAACARLFCPAVVRAVLRWLRRLGVPLCHRTDVAGQVWLDAWESWPRFDPKRGRPERWLNAITVHVASHYRERMQYRREELVDLIDLPDPAPDAFAAMEADSIRTGAVDAVNELDPQLRFVLRAHDLDGIPMAQVAEDAGLPLSTLYKRRTNALGALRDCRSPSARHEPQRDPRGRRRG